MTVLLRICSKGIHGSAAAVLGTAIGLEFLGRGLVPLAASRRCVSVVTFVQERQCDVNNLSYIIYR